MDSTLKPKQSDDPHDVLMVAPDAVMVAPTDEELSKLAHTLRQNPPPRTGSDLNAGPTVPPVDTTFRPAAVGDIPVPGRRRSIGARAARTFTALLFAACIGVAAIAWQSSSNVAKQLIATWAPQFILTSWLPLENPARPAQPTPPAVEAAAANAGSPQPASLAQTASAGVTPTATLSPESAQLLQSMARDLATVGQEIEQLKASIAELKASQQQMSRDVARASEQSMRPRISAPPTRSAAARARTPMPSLPPPQAAAAPTSPQAVAPSGPRQPEPQPQATAQPQADPELASVPRPPMPVR
jgi:hypothetical protein